MSTVDVDRLGDARGEPDTGRPPCDFCRRSVPCECATTRERFYGDETCMCTCGRCKADPLPEYRGPWVFDGKSHWP